MSELSTTELSPTAQGQLATIRRAFAGIAEFSADKMLEHYTDDLVLEMPYTEPAVTLEGKPTILKYLRGAFKVFHFSIDITDVHELVDPTMLILEYTSKGTVTTTGKVYANRYVGVYWFRDDKICRVREYFNPAVTAEALAP
ncbi:MAG TPA: nuclear transport factor 2 family protein [Acidimicrobiales bacterium]|nr:nuclear transport factor 2 family protein [Acidimicrobiales bacterium]